ncbi:hypothetical protein [Mycobacterium talmoniae]|uniref:Integral membrane protein n=1 Tax=Mycobacterium talmoniae TaxID=1858794 RepID=A0A1S1NRI6_9MYCO|nr:MULTISPECIES: hypothetical protein [Mycobacterium]OHV05561.1 hypothetical protein BKN37_05085 [Mycobacterium talmoniae]TDH55460.1 hypothetical protein E2F47_09615 [Mycobacterium eburneum]
MRAVPQALSAGCGLLMAAAAAAGVDGWALAATVAAAALVLAGVTYRPAATVAVLLTVVAITLGDPAPPLAALAGLGGTGYLVLRHTGAVTVPTLTAAAGFTFAGLVGTAFPLSLPWLPLLAPLAVFGIYALALHPFLGAPLRVRRTQRR